MQPAMIDTFQKGNVLIFRGGLFLSISDYLCLMSVWCPSAVAAPLAISANTSPGFSLCPPPLGPYLCGRTVPDAGPASGQALSLHPHSHANCRVHLRWTQPLNRLQSCVTRVTWESENSAKFRIWKPSPVQFRTVSRRWNIPGRFSWPHLSPIFQSDWWCEIRMIRWTILPVGEGLGRPMTLHNDGQQPRRQASFWLHRRPMDHLGICSIVVVVVETAERLPKC